MTLKNWKILNLFEWHTAEIKGNLQNKTDCKIYQIIENWGSLGGNPGCLGDKLVKNHKNYLKLLENLLNTHPKTSG